MIHIAPWQCCLGLMRGAGRHLAAHGGLVLYGPFRLDGAHTAPSNAAFDASLRSQNAEWGVRDTADIAAAAGKCGLRLADIMPMPANNFTLVLTRVG
jgi:hypothetical protein